MSKGDGHFSYQLNFDNYFVDLAEYFSEAEDVTEFVNEIMYLLENVSELRVEDHNDVNHIIYDLHIMLKLLKNNLHCM
ncbi:hypothetical protein PRVXT_000227 [Proteinivorax tanatarense]|uniref:Uncharacterized protein n=1 Tax=Proteinivorax tanatarense TaxID=1260629 RepID=A0AAU7VMK9_9FIRM